MPVNNGFPLPATAADEDDDEDNVAPPALPIMGFAFAAATKRVASGAAVAAAFCFAAFCFAVAVTLFF